MCTNMNVWGGYGYENEMKQHLLLLLCSNDMLYLYIKYNYYNTFLWKAHKVGLVEYYNYIYYIYILSLSLCITL